jgi:hypothetical protein
LYLLGIPQLLGTVRHYHHLVWFAALLAASPSGDALSLDALLGARRGRPIAPRPPIAYALPLRFAWVLVACVYFFPGLWKWRAAGWQWALSDNLRNQMRWKWLQYNWPGLCRAAALATMIFEVGFPLALPFRRLRAAAVTTAIGFHLATAALMRISFPSLWLTYVMFVPWRRAPPAPPYGRARLAPTVIVGALLLAGAAWAGLRGAVQAWPFACYPTFQWMAPDEMPALEVDLVGADGQVRTLGPRWSDPDPQRSWGQTWSLVLSPDGRALESFLRLHSSAPFSEARFYRVYLDVDPDRWSQPPRARTLIQRTTQTVRDPVTPANPDAKR